MNSNVKALRAITAIFLQKIFKPTAWIIGGVGVVLWGLVLYLGAAVHPLWYALIVLLLPATLILIAIGCLTWIVSNKFLPRKLTREERQIIHTFTDKLLHLAEVRATPFPIMAFLIAKDVVRSRKSSFIESTIQDASSLSSDFKAISRFF